MRGLPDMLRLAGPLALMHLGYIALGIVDSAVLGRYDSAAMAGAGVASLLVSAITMTGIGIIQGMDTLVPQALGAGNPDRARGLLSSGTKLAALLTIPFTGVVALIPCFMSWIDVAATAQAEALPYVLARLPGVAPMLFFAADRSYLQAKGHTRPLVIAMLVANLINVGADFALVFGVPSLGIPELGSVGAGIASTLVSIAIWAVGWISLRGGERRAPPISPGVASIVRYGLPVGLQIAAEFGLFATVGLLAGRLGETPAAAHMVAISLATSSYAMALGVGGATSVLVGHAIGAGDVPGARRAGALGMLLAVGTMGAAGVVFLLGPQFLAQLFTPFENVVEAAVPLVYIAAAFQLSDAVQAVAAGALRGIGDTRFSFVANLVCHYTLGLPVAVGLAFYAGLGASGLWWGLTAGLTGVAVIVAARFFFRTRGHVELS